MIRSVLLAIAGLLMCGATVQAAEAVVAVNEQMFGCVHEGTKIRKTYIRHADPAKLKEAVRIYENKIEGAVYPVGTIIQMVPHEVMVKHAKDAFPNSNGWEFLALKVTAEGATFAGRGDTAANPRGTCLSCHQLAAKHDFICDKGQGCPPVPVGDDVILAMQDKDPRCTSPR